MTMDETVVESDEVDDTLERPTLLLPHAPTEVKVWVVHTSGDIHGVFTTELGYQACVGRLHLVSTGLPIEVDEAYLDQRER